MTSPNCQSAFAGSILIVHFLAPSTFQPNENQRGNHSNSNDLSGNSNMIHSSASSLQSSQNNSQNIMSGLLGNGGPGSRASGVMPDLLPQQPLQRSSPRDKDAVTDEVQQLLLQYRQAAAASAAASGKGTPLHLQSKQRSFLTFGFGAGGGSGAGSPLSTGVSNPMASPSPRRESSAVNVNVATGGGTTDTPEIRKYKKRFNSEILCAALWGVNLLIGTESGLMLLDRSGQGKVYQLISRRRFQQMEVLEGQNILVTISGKKARVRVYYLSWLKSKIIRTDQVGNSFAGDILCVHLTNVCHSLFLKRSASGKARRLGERRRPGRRHPFPDRLVLPFISAFVVVLCTFFYCYDCENGL